MNRLTISCAFNHLIDFCITIIYHYCRSNTLMRLPTPSKKQENGQSIAKHNGITSITSHPIDHTAFFTFQ